MLVNQRQPKTTKTRGDSQREREREGEEREKEKQKKKQKEEEEKEELEISFSSFSVFLLCANHIPLKFSCLQKFLFLPIKSHKFICTTLLI